MTADHSDAAASTQASHIVQDQDDVFRFLSSPSTYGSTDTVTRIDTHGAAVFLVGEHAYKVKRAVRFPFMDFSTLAKRRQACEAEVAINRPNAPGLYLGTIAVVRRAGALFLGGAGEAVEWLVDIRRFALDRTFDRIADRGALTTELIDGIATAIAVAQSRAAVRSAVDVVADLRRVVTDNATGLNESAGIFDCSRVEALTDACLVHLDRVAFRLGTRAADGLVRRCHGDLHLRNIVLLEDKPILFDALEFDESLATIDVLYDLAFLLMDLLDRDLVFEANYLFNRYLAAWGDDRQLMGLAALPLFISVRAAIRAKVVAAGLAHVAASEARTAEVGARRYFDLAESVLVPRPPHLVAIGGLSGTGKTTLGRRLAPGIGIAPGAVHLRSDIERKRLCGVAEFDRLPATAYGMETNRAVYDALRRKAELAIRGGYSVVVDAVHQRAEERDALSALARRLSVRFTGLWLEAPIPELIDRVSQRTRDASDAGPETVWIQAERETDAIAWCRLDTGSKAMGALAAAREVIARDT